MPIRIKYLALWTQDLERSRNFYIKYFGARSNEKHHNPNKQLETYFLRFERAHAWKS